MGNRSNKNKRSIIIWSFGVLFCVAAVSAAIDGDFRLLFVICTYLILTFLLKYIAHPRDWPNRIDKFLKRREKLITRVVAILFIGLLLLIVVLRFLVS